MSARERTRRGQTIARLLAGAWRPSPPPVDLPPAEARALEPLLLGNGTAAVASRRLDPARQPPSFAEALRYQRLLSALLDRGLPELARLLAQARVTPLLGKGWAAARLWAEPALRIAHGTDVDLYALPREAAAARAALARFDAARCPVDLHEGFSQLAARDAAAIHRRAPKIPFGDAALRIFSPEDHLALLALHALGHGLVRPIWLADLAAAVEQAAPAFDWPLCLGEDPLRAHWIACALRLACDLLGAPLPDAVRDRAPRLPRWMAPALLDQWGAPFRQRQPIAELTSHPFALVRELYRRWPNAIEATVDLRAPFDDRPRLPLQLGEIVARTTRFLRR
jgi:hypothetical protein